MVPGAVFRDATVTKVLSYGAFVAVQPGVEALLHISEVQDGFVEDIGSHLSVGQTIDVIVLSSSPAGKGRYSLSCKQCPPRDGNGADSSLEPATPPARDVSAPQA